MYQKEIAPIKSIEETILIKQWIDLHEAGSYPQGNVTVEDYQNAIRLHNENKWKPPVTIEHPKQGDKAPALAWIDELRVQGSKLQATIKDVVQEAVDYVQGKYKYVSSGFRRGDAGLYLHHVGLFGGNAPHIKTLDELNLKSLNFGENDKYIVFEDQNKESKLEESEKVTKEEFEALQKENEQLKKEKEVQEAKAKADKEEYEKKLKEAEKERIKRELEASFEPFVKLGKLTPAEKDQLLNFGETLSIEKELNFSEDGKNRKESQMDLFSEIMKNLIEKREYVIDFTEQVKETPTPTKRDHSTPQDNSADAKIQRRAEEIFKLNSPNKDYKRTDALKQAIAEFEGGLLK